MTPAVQDMDRLAHPGGPPLPDAPWSSRGWITASVRSSIESAVEQVGRRPDDPRTPAAVLGLAALTGRLGLLDEYAADLADEAERLVWPVLAERGGPDLVAAAGPVPDEVLAATVRSSLPDGVRQRMLGEALDYAVLRWLYPDGPPDAGRLDDRLRVEYAYQLWSTTPSSTARTRRSQRFVSSYRRVSRVSAPLPRSWPTPSPSPPGRSTSCSRSRSAHPAQCRRDSSRRP